MNKNKFFTAVITIVISIIILLVIVNLIFNNTNINQGNFRVSDAILSSIVELEDKAENNNEWKFDISQKNKLSMLIQSNENINIKEVYLEKIKVKSKNDVSIYIEQEKHDISYKYSDIKNKKVNIYTEETEDGNCLIEINVNNEDIAHNFNVPKNVKEIRHDGTVLNVANIAISDIMFSVKYNLIVVEDNGKINKCKVKLEMPDSKIATEGLYVERLDSSKFNFKVDY